MSIGKRLALLRKTLDIPQTEMAMVIGCSQGNLSQYEKDSPIIPVKCIIPLRVTYNVNLDWLLLGVGDMFLPDMGVQQQVEKATNVVSVKNKARNRLIKEMDELTAEVDRKVKKMKGYLSEE